MDYNIFNLLDDDAEMPKSIQQKLKNIEKNGVETDSLTIKILKILTFKA